MRRSTPIRAILLQLSLMSFMGMSYAVLLPVFARDILLGGAHTQGFLVGSAGAGAMMGALYLAARESVLGLGRLIALSSGLFGIGVILFALSNLLPLSMLTMVGIGFGLMVQMAASNTILQTIVEEDKRGRTMSLFTVSFMGVAPFGSLFTGSLASHIGAPKTLLICGTCCLLGAVLFYRKLPEIRKAVRPIYREMGIFPPSAKP